MYLYVHLPFCKKKCNYCDFVSYAGKEGMIDAYVEALTREIETSPLSPPAADSFPSPLKMERGGTNEVSDGGRTVFFGGGTPTLLEPRHFDKIISTLISHSSLDISHSEISIEANPGTADKAKLKALRELGINRLSIGAQSFNSRHLKTLGRIHNPEDIKRIFADARSVGFENINLDLMFALPDQTFEEWKTDLQTAIDLGPDHLSTYNLQIEENTPLKAQLITNNLQLPTEEEELKMYEYTIESLTGAGFKHYEISNFARPGYECQHNINYWKNGNYFGVGAGAHSHVNGKRWSNPNCIEEYIRQASGETRNEMRDALRGTDDVSHIATAQRETLFLGLRLLDGIPTGKFNGFEKEVSELFNDGLLEEKDGNYRLTRKGLYLGNLVFEKFV
jgi:oxygen-independent coproporphyrinogen-3 oxidase